jgi:hypothetical protein
MITLNPSVHFDILKIIMTFFTIYCSASNAQSARAMLNNKDYGFQYSANFLDDYESEDDEMNVGFLQTLGYIGSADSIVPKSFIYTLNSKLGGWMKPSKVCN